MVIGFRSAFRGGTDFLFYLVWEVSVLSFVFHNECDFLINSRLGRKSKGKQTNFREIDSISFVEQL